MLNGNGASRGFIVGVALIAVAVNAASTVSSSALTRGDARWLNRVTFGVTAATVAQFERLGRKRFLDEQLQPSTDPESLTAELHALTLLDASALDRIRANRIEQQRINTLPSEEAKQQARMALNQRGNEVLYETTKRHLIRAVESPWQLREQMTWFWMNHFSVFQGKANIRWTLGEYEDTVRAHAFGKFADLVMATVTAPAMLEYLDNAQSAVGKINENYARELMELHTLGVSGGPSGSTYSQFDVQELARVLTGVGLNVTDTEPKLPSSRQALYVHRGLFEFNPARHDMNVKTVLGRTFDADGLQEVERVVTMLCRQPATARFISTKLATYFVADPPPTALVDRMTATFVKTDGSIASVLRTLFLDQAFIADLGAATPRFIVFKDPMHFVVSSLRLAYDGKMFPNYRPVIGWLQQLGEPLYGRVTPDGYPLTESAWSSSGQLIRRFEIARAIGSGSAGLFNGDDNKPGPTVGFPFITTRLFYDDIESMLRPQTRDVLNHTGSQQEWNTMVLASPEWMFR